MTARLRRLAPAPRTAALVVVAALLFTLAMPPVASVAAAVAVPALFAVFVCGPDRRSGWSAVRDGWWFGIAASLGSAWWIARALGDASFTAGVLGTALSVVWNGSGAAIAAGVLHQLAARRRWPIVLALPVTWVAGEWVVGHMPDIGLSWVPLALSLAPHPMLAQFAELSGPSGLSFALAAAGALVGDAWLASRDASRRRRSSSDRSFRVRSVAMRLVGAAACIGALAAFGSFRLATVRPRALGRVAVIQPNVSQADKNGTGTERAQVARLAALSRTTAASRPDLVVWPETALNGFLREFPEWPDTLRAVTQAVGAPLVTGGVDLDLLGGGHFLIYNAALFVGRDGAIDPLQRYRKETLVPITEMTPFLRFLPFVREEAAGYGRGNGQSPFRTDVGRVGVLICFESAFASAGRAARRAGAQVLLVLTNDAWFGRSAAPSQHLAHLRLRAIETRTGAVQTANSGPSAVIDPLGRVVAQTPLFTTAAPTFAVSTTDLTTPFVRFGDSVGLVCLLVVVGAGLVTRMPLGGRVPSTKRSGPAR